MTSPQRLLHVTSEVPWPLTSGGRLRTYHLARELSRAFDVHMLAGTSHRGIATTPPGLACTAVPLAPRTAMRELRRLLGARLDGEPYVMYRRHDRPEMWEAVRHTVGVQPPAAVFLDHLDSWIYRRATAAPAVVDLHNAYSLLTRRVADDDENPVRRWFLRTEVRLLAEMERAVARHADLLLAVSDEEAEYFQSLGPAPVAVVPNGVDASAFASLPVGRAGAAPLILYLGTMSWAPNAEAAAFLAEQVLPRVREAVPGARLRIVGRAAGPDVRRLANREGVEVVCDAPEIAPHLREAAVLAVPLTSGGGTRLKVLEAFAAGLPVVSTPVGAEGIRARHGEHLLMAERAVFHDAISAILGDAEGAVALATRARRLAVTLYDWPVVGAEAVRAIQGVVGLA